MRPEGSRLPATGRETAAANPAACPACSGTGFQVIQDSDSGRSYARTCECRRREEAADKERMARIPRRFISCEMETFWRGPEFDPTVNAAYERTLDFVHGYTARKAQGEKEFGLLFVGPPGVGKTHLAVAALRSLVADHGVKGLFADFREIIKTIQASFNPVSGTSEMEVLRPLLQAEVLLLDDLGVCRMTEWVRDVVGHIINTRYNEGRVTLITTNLADDETGPGISGKGDRGALARKVAARASLSDRIGPEVRSRLHEMCELVAMDDEDYRLRVGRHGRRTGA